MKNIGKIVINDKKSLSRPAWIQSDLHAFNNKHSYNPITKRQISYDYYIKSKGF